MGCATSQKDTDSFGLLSKPHVFFLLGGPGSGKGTQAEYLIRDYKFKHLSTGDLLREEIAKGGKLAQTIQKSNKEGKLFSSDLVVELLQKSISTHGNRRYLLDGFPRNQENWKEFESKLADHVVVRNLIYFDCPVQTLIDRMTERSKTSGRSDDNPQTMKKRIQTFETETIPIVKSFEERGNCIRVDATKSREQVYTSLRNQLTAAHILPPNPAQMLFVLGGPGSGKGTQCDVLVKRYNFIHLSTGDLLRDQIRSGSPLAKQLNAIMKQGKLISSEHMVKLIREKIQSYNFGGRYLLDGFPRGQQNMDVWQKEMSKWVNLNEQELKKRLLERGKTSGRADDNQESINKRLKVFNDQTKPVVDFYQKQNKLHRFDANREITAITEDVQKHLDSLGIFPANS